MDNRKLTILIFSLISILPVFGETVLSSLEEIAAYGSENSLDYLNGQVNLMKAKDNIQSLLLLEDTAVSLEGSLSDAEESLALNSRIEIPIIEQISISGNLDQEKTGSVSLNLKPLAHSDNSEQSMINYQSALISAENSRTEAEYKAVSAALGWMSAKREHQSSRDQTDLYETKYKDDKARYELDEISFDDLQESLVSWSEQRISLSEKEKTLRSAESLLYASLGASMEDVSIDILTIDHMKKVLEEIKKEMELYKGDSMNSSSYKLASLARDSAEVTLKNTWLYNPDLTASAAVNFDSEGYKGFNASVNFSISLDDIQKKDRDVNREELKIATKQEIQSRNEAEVDYIQVLQSLDSTGLNRETSLIEYEQKKILYSEAKLLQKRGDISQWELDESYLSLQISEDAAFKALADEYLAWFSLKNYQ